MDIKVRNVVIIGGATGIGYATAQAFLDAGVNSVYVSSRSESKMRHAAQNLRCYNNQKVLFGELDIADCKSHIEFLEKITSEIGTIPDGLVISSGIHRDSGGWRGFNTTEEDWDTVMNINLKGTFFLMRNFTNYLCSKSVKGKICIVSSQAAHRDLLGAYPISKNAISGVIHAYGKHLVEKGIILNGIEPGLVDTPMMSYFHEYTNGIREGKIWGDNSIHRIIRPEEIAKLILFLMSEGSEIMAGTVLLANGGCKSITI